MIVQSAFILSCLALISCAGSHHRNITDPAGNKIMVTSLNKEAPIIIAHRGASGYRPEHTLAAYQLAIDMGADFIEPDLVITRDGVLVARHDRYLSTTTDVAIRAEFADRKTTKSGHDGADWFVEDFTLAELKTLRAIQPRAGRNTDYDGLFEIPTLKEILDLACENRTRRGGMVGVYPETKHPAALEALGLSFDKALLSALDQSCYKSETDLVFIQSFDPEILRRLRPRTDFRLIYLFEKMPPESLNDIAQFADGIGPYKRLLLDDDGNDTGFVSAAHDFGLKVHPWTFRDDALPEGIVDPVIEMSLYFDIGIDGLFTDFADTGVRARTLWRSTSGT